MNEREGEGGTMGVGRVKKPVRTWASRGCILSGDMVDMDNSNSPVHQGLWQHQHFVDLLIKEGRMLQCMADGRMHGMAIVKENRGKGMNWQKLPCSQWGMMSSNGACGSGT